MSLGHNLRTYEEHSVHDDQVGTERGRRSQTVLLSNSPEPWETLSWGNCGLAGGEPLLEEGPEWIVT